MNPHNTSYGIRKASFYNDSSIYPEEISSDVEKLFSYHAQAALKTDGSVIVWGHNSYGGNICHSSYGVRDLNSTTVNPSVLGPNCGVKNIIHNTYSFLALKEDGSIHMYGVRTVTVVTFTIQHMVRDVEIVHLLM